MTGSRGEPNRAKLFSHLLYRPLLLFMLLGDCSLLLL